MTVPLFFFWGVGRRSKLTLIGAFLSSLANGAYLTSTDKPPREAKGGGFGLGP